MASTQLQVTGADLRPIIVSGPSGVGKGTLIQRLIDSNPGKFSEVVSHTTRGPRPGEIEGVAYHFVSSAKFSSIIAEGGFIEHTIFSGHHYGTSKEAIARQNGPNSVILLDIDIEGVKAIQKSQSLDARYVFIKPPSFEVLESRLRARGTDGEIKIQERLARARTEVEYAETSGVYDKIIINDDLDTAYERLKAFAYGH
ncbi:hypothetical protein FGRMN_5315 [Fusarium graminum]|nr:hypothetical protein FGRMN_5315 [Fusarium graminum]